MVRAKSAARSKKQSYHHGDLRSALMQGALQLIDQYGIKGFTLKDAAAAAGVSTAAPYRHFVDKDALVRAIQVEGFGLFNASLAAAFANGASPRDRIVELGLAYVRFALEHTVHFELMFSLPSGSDPLPESEIGSAYHMLVQAVTALHPDATPEKRNDLVVVCWSLVHGYALLYLNNALGEGAKEGEAQLRRALTLLVEKAEE